MAVSIFGSSFHLRATKCPEVLPLDSTFSRNRFWEDATTKYEEKVLTVERWRCFPPVNPLCRVACLNLSQHRQVFHFTSQLFNFALVCGVMKNGQRSEQCTSLQTCSWSLTAPCPVVVVKMPMSSLCLKHPQSPLTTMTACMDPTVEWQQFHSRCE